MESKGRQFARDLIQPLLINVYIYKYIYQAIIGGLGVSLVASAILYVGVNRGRKSEPEGIRRATAFGVGAHGLLVS